MNQINASVLTTPMGDDMEEKKLTITALKETALTMREPSDFPWKKIWEKVNNKALSDEARIIIMRAMIYNPHMRPHFKNISEEFNHVIRSLIVDNKKLNYQISKPIDSVIKSCVGDTLMHCAGRMGYSKLMYLLYNNGAGDSLSIKNNHGYSPVASISNQRERIVDGGMEKDKNGHPICTLTPMEKYKKENDLRGLDEARKTYHDLVGEETLMNSKLVREAVVKKEPENATKAGTQALKESGTALVEGNKIKSGWKLIQALGYLLHVVNFKKDKNPLIDEALVINNEQEIVKLNKVQKGMLLCHHILTKNMPIARAISRTI